MLIEFAPYRYYTETETISGDLDELLVRNRVISTGTERYW